MNAVRTPSIVSLFHSYAVSSDTFYLRLESLVQETRFPLLFRTLSRNFVPKKIRRRSFGMQLPAFVVFEPRWPSTLYL